MARPDTYNRESFPVDLLVNLYIIFVTSSPLSLRMPFIEEGRCVIEISMIELVEYLFTLRVEVEQVGMSAVWRTYSFFGDPEKDAFVAAYAILVLMMGMSLRTGDCSWTADSSVVEAARCVDACVQVGNLAEPCRRLLEAVGCFLETGSGGNEGFLLEALRDVGSGSTVGVPAARVDEVGEVCERSGSMVVKAAYAVAMSGHSEELVSER